MNVPLQYQSKTLKSNLAEKRQNIPDTLCGFITKVTLPLFKLLNWPYYSCLNSTLLSIKLKSMIDSPKKKKVNVKEVEAPCSVLHASPPQFNPNLCYIFP